MAIEDEVEVLRAEVSVVRAKLLEVSRPWYQNVATLISVMAFAFSFGTTIVAWVRLAYQDRHDRRVELRALLTRLTAVPRDAAELTIKYPSSKDLAVQAALTQISSNLNMESQMLTRQAYDLIVGIPEYVTPAECISVGVGLMNGGRIDRAEEMMKLAERRAVDASDATAARRNLGLIGFLSGDAPSGRKYFQSALDVFNETRFGNPNDTFRASMHRDTERYWAQAERAVGSADKAEEHERQAEKWQKEIGPTALQPAQPIEPQFAPLPAAPRPPAP